MPGLLESISDELAPIIDAALAEIGELIQGGQGHDALLRRFRQQYDTLPIESIAALQEVLGHQDDEDQPCQVCQIMAAKEVQLGKE